MPEEPVAAGQRRLSYARSPVPAHEDLQLVPLPVEVALQLLVGSPRPEPDGLRPDWTVCALSRTVCALSLSKGG